MSEEASIDRALAAAAIEEAGGLYRIKSAAEILRAEIPPARLWFPAIALGEPGTLAVFAAPPGLGKSRFLLQYAAARILGRPFCGLDTSGGPVRTLVLQTENTLRRLQRDLAFLKADLTSEEEALLERNLFVSTLEGPSDGDISIDEREPTAGNFYRVKAAIEAFDPEVVLVDTWPSMCANELDARAIRMTVGALRKACSAASAPVTIVLVAHAKPGIQAGASAKGIDALSYCRGNRNLVGIARSVINLRSCDFVEDVVAAAGKEPVVRRGVEIIFAKANDGVLPPPLAVALNAERFVYETIPNFDHAAWQTLLEKLAKSGATETPQEKAAENAKSLTALQDRVRNLLEATGPLGKVALVQKLIEIGASSSKRHAGELIRWLVENGQLIAHQEKVTKPARYFTPEQFKKFKGL